MTTCSTCRHTADRLLTIRAGYGYAKVPRCGALKCQTQDTVLFPIGHSYCSTCKTVGPDHFHTDVSEIRS